MLRNKEIRQFTCVFLLTAAAVSIAAYKIHPAAGLLAAFFAFLSGLLFLGFTRERYKRIARVSEEIDQVLHDADRVYIAGCEEGELSILESEVGKMTARIREQNNALKKEKEHLAQSLADIAHQLKTPLTSANLILSLLEDNPRDEDEAELLRETEELFAQMDMLLTSLLKLSRLDAGIIIFQKERIEVKSLVETAIRPLLIPMEIHEVELTVSVPEGIFIEGDFEWLAEGLGNVLKNCMESAKDRGRVWVACQDNALYTEITVRDSGKGFKEEELTRVFDRYYRGKDTRTAGFGIGLALCRNIITRQNGTVTARNHPEGGAVFTIRFPK
ncbi:MAG: HAMP domain-containing histidine kinase [Dorea sp.]|nr:HAMP domain-containing histidine kinase [Dorea sp.]